MQKTITLTIDGAKRTATIDTRVTVLDLLREHLGVIAPKKGCDHGQCGSCTVLLNGRRVTTCLAFAVQHDGAEITTAAGLGTAEDPHPMQRAFLDHDAFQCGYCTPGQICSAVGLLDEVDVKALDDEQLRDRMSGNLCRCGAYVNIVAAIRSVAT